MGDLEGLAVDGPELLDQLVDAPFGLVPGHDQGVLAPGLDLEPQVEQVGLDLDAVLRVTENVQRISSTERVLSAEFTV